MKNLLVFTILITATQGFLFPKIKTVDELDVNKYLGRWYEVCITYYISYF